MHRRKGAGNVNIIVIIFLVLGIRYLFIWQMMRSAIEVIVIITLIHIKCLYVCTYCISSHNMCMATNVTSEAIKNVTCFMFVLLDDFNAV